MPVLGFSVHAAEATSAKLGCRKLRDFPATGCAVANRPKKTNPRAPRDARIFPATTLIRRFCVVQTQRVRNRRYDCVLGSRFVKGGGTIDYSCLKLKINRLANVFLRMLFRIKLDDTTNAFKAYRRTVIGGCRPFLSPHFNLAIEISLKAIIRAYSWKWCPSPGAIARRRPRRLQARATGCARQCISPTEANGALVIYRLGPLDLT